MNSKYTLVEFVGKMDALILLLKPFFKNDKNFEDNKFQESLRFF